MDRVVPFLDLRVCDKEVRKRLLQAVDRVLCHGRLIMGPEVEAFEREIANRCGRRFAVGVGSGTDALYLALRALDVGPGDEVVTTALSWVATANTIALVGATPVFADIGADLCIDPSSAERLITSKTKAIVPVHYTGRVCDMDAISRIADERGIAIIEDVAQAFSASRGGRLAGSFGAVACLSMNPMKVLAACGEAGCVVTDDEDVCVRLRALRYNGTVDRETCVEPSLNGRLDTLQAAILLERLGDIERVVRRRRAIAALYDELLSTIVQTPPRRVDDCHVYYTYTIVAENRDRLREHLTARGIETRVQHPILMPDQPAYRDWTRSDCPKARGLVDHILCIPANETLIDDDVRHVAAAIRGFYEAN